MKIEGPNKTGGAQPGKGKGKVSSSGGSFGDLISKGAGETKGASAAQQIARVDALLAVQAAEDPTARAARQRMRKRSESILDELDRLRMAMLNGTLTVGHMVDIADVVASHRERIDDPEMAAILDEIDLRAQVELAKMRIRMDRVEA
ncbi:MAG: flagellar assembly protein FliX [Alphaproteobacteria bacterium]|nr:flagellar assembly protein FliX [Alphaproteobacteria bacterium]